MHYWRIFYTSVYINQLMADMIYLQFTTQYYVTISYFIPTNTIRMNANLGTNVFVLFCVIRGNRKRKYIYLHPESNLFIIYIRLKYCIFSKVVFLRWGFYFAKTMQSSQYKSFLLQIQFHQSTKAINVSGSLRTLLLLLWNDGKVKKIRRDGWKTQFVKLILHSHPPPLFFSVYTMAMA